MGREPVAQELEDGNRSLHSQEIALGGLSCLTHKQQLLGICCCCCVASVVSDSVRPHRLQPTRLHRPWDSPGKNTGVGCHFLLQCMKVKSESEVAQSCLTLSDPMDCSPPGSSVHGIFQARALEWVAIGYLGLHKTLYASVENIYSSNQT